MIGRIKKAIFFCAHTDDEGICAGTLHRLVRQGAEVRVCAFTTAATKEDRRGIHDEGVTELMTEFEDSMKALGITEYWCGGMRPSASAIQEHRQMVCQSIYNTVEVVKPDLVITLSPEDENPAHRVIGEECERVMRGRVPLLWRCQYPWNYAIGKQNVFVELSAEDVEAKRRSIQAYQSQRFRYNYEEIFMHQIRVDGLSVKVPYAEKFELVRAVV